MARKQRLINLHNGAKKAPKASELYLGEIAVQHNVDEAAIYTKVADDKVAKFIDETAVNTAISTSVAAASSALTVDIEALDGRVDALEALSAETRIEELESESHSHANAGVLSGITAEKVAAWDAAGGNAKEYVDGVLSAYTKTTGMTEAIATAKSEAIGSASSYTDTKLASYATSAQTVAAIKAVDDKFASYVTSAQTETAIKAVDDKFASYVTSAQTETAIEAAKAAASADTAAQIEALDLANTYAAKGYETKVDTLVGTDTDKSVRALAAEEVAKIVASADTRYDTLKEIADWIISDTTGAAKMANDIEDLKAISADTRIEKLEEDTHTHDNIDVLTGITAEKVAAWDAAGGNAKEYVDGVLSAYTKTTGMTEAIATAKSEAIGSASSYTDTKLASYATSAQTVAAIEAVDAKFDNVVKTVEMADDDTSKSVKASVSGTTATFDLSELIIDCGEYEGE